MLAIAAVATGVAVGRLAIAQEAGSQLSPSGPGRAGQPNPRESGLSLPADLSATPAPGRAGRSTGPSPTSSPTSGATARGALRQRRARRSRPPTLGQIQGDFRASLAPPDVAVEVQPVQSGLPDPVLAATPLRRRPVETDPYAPVGIQVGSVNLFPLIGESIGYDSNPNRTQTGVRSSFLSQTEGELRVQSDWSRHELSGLLRGAYNDYPSNTAANRPEGAGRLGLRLDVTRDTQVDLEGRFQVDTQRPGSPDLNAIVSSRPVVFSEGASIGGTQRFNRFVVNLRGSVDRSDYEDAKLTNGTTLDQSDRNLTAYGLRARFGYELKPGLVPFVQGDLDQRDYDRRIDSSGYARSSDGIGGRIGTTFEVSRLLTGEVTVGAQNRRYEDKRLGDLTSPVGDLSLSYAFSPITTIKATAQAGIDETTVLGANGIRTVKGSLEVSHDLRRNLTLTAGVNFADYDYQGVNITERGFGALLRADYRLTRQIALRASYSYDEIRSTVAGSSYATNVFLLGVRLQP